MPGPTSTRVKSASRPTGGTAGSRLKSATTAKRPFQSAALPSLPKKDLLPKKDVGFSKEDLCLLRACESGDLDSVYKQIWDKANVNCRKPLYGSSPLSVACRTGNAKIVSVLLEFGATPTSVDEYGVTPLHWAANSGKPKILNSLLNKGKLGSVDLAKKDQYGSTPLHFASVRNLAESVQTLIAAGSDPTTVNNEGKKPSDITSSPTIKKILIEQEEKIARAIALQKQASKAGKKKKKPKAASPGTKKVAGAKTPQKKAASADALATKQKAGSSTDGLAKMTPTGVKMPENPESTSSVASDLKKKPGAKRFVSAAPVGPKT